MSEYKLDLSKYTIDDQPRMWTDAEYREAFQSLYFEYHKIKAERDQYKAERDTLNNKLNQAYENGYQMEGELHDMTKQRDTLIDDLTWYKAKVDRLEWTLRNKEDEIDWRDSKLDRLQHENKRLTRLTHKLTTHRTMWDELKQWRRDMLDIDKNDQQLIGLGLMMNDLEKEYLYKEDDR